MNNVNSNNSPKKVPIMSGTRDDSTGLFRKATAKAARFIIAIMKVTSW
jgi:hypothetical protein